MNPIIFIKFKISIFKSYKIELNIKYNDAILKNILNLGINHVSKIQV